MEESAKTNREYIQLEYVMGKRPCPRFKGKSADILPFLEAYGMFFKTLEEAQKTLHRQLNALLKDLP